MDGYAITSPDILNLSPNNRPLIVTALYINGKLTENNGKSIRYTNHIELNHNQNNFAIEFSDLPYSLEEKINLYTAWKE